LVNSLTAAFVCRRLISKATSPSTFALTHSAVMQVDTFTPEGYSGNPAAVCLLAHDLSASTSDASLQLVAHETNLSATAFVTLLSDTDTFTHASAFGLRWYSPTMEIDLCGHDTLAAAAVLFRGAPGTTCHLGDAESTAPRCQRRYATAVTSSAALACIAQDPPVRRAALCCALLRHTKSGESTIMCGCAECGNHSNELAFYTRSGKLTVTRTRAASAHAKSNTSLMDSADTTVAPGTGLTLTLPAAPPDDALPEACSSIASPLVQALVGDLQARSCTG
jgi:Phenazine biosynthesis-like protein